MRFRTVRVFFLLALFLVGCGKSIRRAQQVGLPVEVGIPSPRSGPTVLEPLTCQAISSAAILSAFADTNGNLYPNIPAPMAVIKVVGARGVLGTKIKVTKISTSSADLKVEIPPANDYLDQTQFNVRPYKAGVHTAQISVVSQEKETEIVTCSVQLELKTTSAPDLQVQLLANGVANTITLAEGEGATLSYQAVNSGSCSITRNGITVAGLTNLVASSGEYGIGPFINITPVPITNIYEITCTAAANTGATKKALVTVVINPVPTASLAIVGSPSPVTVRVGSSVDITWTSTYATRGCTVTDGVKAVAQPPSGTVSIVNISASATLTLSCRDGYRGNAISTVGVIVLNPQVSLTANGVSGTYTQGIRQDFTVAWSGTDVTSCAFIGRSENGLSGSFSVKYNLQRRDVTYDVECQSRFGVVTKSLTVIYPGDWYQTSPASFKGNDNCSNYCSDFLNRANVNSPEGSKCASGMLYPPSAVGRISLNEGCGAYSCSSAHGPLVGISAGDNGEAYCFATNQTLSGVKSLPAGPQKAYRVQGCFCK